MYDVLTQVDLSLLMVRDNPEAQALVGKPLDNLTTDELDVLLYGSSPLRLAYRVLEEIDSILAPYAECAFQPPFFENVDILHLLEYMEQNIIISH